MNFSILSLMCPCAIVWLLAASVARAAPYTSSGDLTTRQSTGPSLTDKLVFCHFIIGIIDDRTSSTDYDSDMQQAHAAGIDAFALDIGVDPFTGTQLDNAYQSASRNNMYVFISFDFNWYSTSMTTAIGTMIKTYASEPAQLRVGGKVFVSTFAGDGLDLDAVSSAAGMARDEIFFAPNFQPGNLALADGLLNWMAWPNNGNNKAPDGSNNLTVLEGDKSYMTALGTSKPYIAPVSAWFSTHFGPEAPNYSKNWVFPSNSLWFDRWTDVLTLGSQYLEIITWNDYGESHYVGPLSSSHIDDGNSKWTNDMPHDGLLQMAIPYIKAWKAGAQSVDAYIGSDQLIYWYRPSLKSASCDATDNCETPTSKPNPNYFIGKPDGYDSMEDSVFVVALLTSAGTVQVTSGGNQPQSFSAQAGANLFQVPMSTGKQSFSLVRSGKTVLSGDSLKNIISDCVCGIYNFNAYVGTLPAGPSDPLQPDGFKSFSIGMQDSCQATPSLGTAPASGNDATPTAITTAETGGPSAAASRSSFTVGSPSSSSPLPVYNSPINTIVADAVSKPNPNPNPLLPTPTTTGVPVAGGGGGSGSKTITALSQLYPTNCMQAGYVWAGPPGSDPAAYCDGG